MHPGDGFQSFAQHSNMPHEKTSQTSTQNVAIVLGSGVGSGGAFWKSRSGGTILGEQNGGKNVDGTSGTVKLTRSTNS